MANYTVRIKILKYSKKIINYAENHKLIVVTTCSWDFEIRRSKSLEELSSWRGGSI